MSFFTGTPERIQQIPTGTPQQQGANEQLLALIQKLLPGAFGNLENILSNEPGSLEAFQAPLMRQFNEQIVPSIAAKYGSLLGEGGGTSSAFGNALEGAGERLSETFGAQKAGLQNDALTQLLNLFQQGMKPQHENLFRPRQPGFLEQGAKGLIGALPSFAAGGFI